MKSNTREPKTKSTPNLEERTTHQTYETDRRTTPDIAFTKSKRCFDIAKQTMSEIERRLGAVEGQFDDAEEDYSLGALADFANVTPGSLKRALDIIESANSEEICSLLDETSLKLGSLNMCDDLHRYDRDPMAKVFKVPMNTDFGDVLMRPSDLQIDKEIGKNILSCDNFGPVNHEYNELGLPTSFQEKYIWSDLPEKIPVNIADEIPSVGLMKISFDLPDIRVKTKRFEVLAGDPSLYRGRLPTQVFPKIKFRPPIKVKLHSISDEFVSIDNWKQVINYVRDCCKRAELLCADRVEWVNSTDIWSEISDQGVLYIQSSGSLMLTQTTQWRQPAYSFNFWLLLAAMSYDFPEFSSHELAIIDRFPIFTLLLKRDVSCAKLHLEWVLKFVEFSNKEAYKDEFATSYYQAQGRVSYASYIRYSCRVSSLTKWQPFIGAMLILFFVPGSEAMEVSGRSPANNFVVGYIIFIFTILQTLYTLYSQRKTIEKKICKVLDIEQGELKSELDKAFSTAKHFRAEGIFSGAKDDITNSLGSLGGIVQRKFMDLLVASNEDMKYWSKEVRRKLIRLSAHGMFALLVYASRNHTNTRKYLICAWMLFLGVQLLDSEEDIFSGEKSLHELNLTAEGPLEFLGEVFTSAKDLKRSYYGLIVGRLFERAISSELGLPLKEHFKAAWRNMHFLEDLVNFMTMSAKAIVLLASGAPRSEVMDVFSGCKVDTEWIECQRIADSIPSGMNAVNGYSAQYMYTRFTALRKEYEKRLKWCASYEKPLIQARIININRWMDDLTSKMMGGQPKMQPFVVTLYGQAGVGKSFSIAALNQLLHTVYIAETGDEITPKLDNYSCEDKYDSNLDCATTCILMDDIGVIKHEKREQTVMGDLKRMCGSIVEPFVKADLDSKGKAFNLAKFVIITTNAFDGGVTPEATDPQAGYRRLGITVIVEPKTECFTKTGELDPNKMYSLEGCVSGHCTYEAYKLRTCAKGSAYMDRSMGKMSDVQFMAFIRDKLVEHIRRHELTIRPNKPVFCACNLPIAACTCAKELEAENDIFMDPLVKAKRHFQWYALCAANRLFFRGRLWEERDKWLNWKALWGLNITYFFILLSYLLAQKIHVYILDLMFGTRVCNISRDSLFVELSMLSIVVFISVIHRTLLRYRRALARFSADPRTLPCTDEDHLAKLIPSIWSWKTSLFWTGAIGVAFLSLRRLVARLRLFEQVFRELKPEMGFVSFDDKQKMACEQNETNLWAPVSVEVPKSADPAKTKGATVDDVYEKVRKAIFRVVGTSGSEYTKVHALIICTDIILVPLHTILAARRKNGLIELCQQINATSSLKREVDASEERCVDLPHRDLCVVCCTSFGARADLLPYVSEKLVKGNAEYQGFWARYDPDFVCFEKVPVSVKYDPGFHYVGVDKSVEGYSYRGATWNGLCGSPIILRSPTGCVIAGLHVAGNGAIGKATPLIITELEQALKELRSKCKFSIKATKPSTLLQISGYEVPVSEHIHKNNAANYVLATEGASLVSRGDVGVDYTPKPRVVPNLFLPYAQKYFNVPELVPRNTNAKEVWNQLLLNSTCAMPPIIPLHLNMAVDDYLNGVDSLISYRQAQDNSVLVFGRSYTLNEALNGIDGHPCRFSINASTSAGFPINGSKSKVFLGEPGKWYLKPEIEDALFEAELRLVKGEHTGCVYKVTPKDEGCAPEKKDKPRLFQAGSIVGLLLQIMYLGPTLDFMTQHPNFFEIAIGVNPMDISWHNVVARAFTRFEKGFEIDYSKYDQTQHPDIKTAVAKVFTLLTMKIGNYPSSLQDFIECLCYEFVCPLINSKGALIECPNLMPSGTFTTAHGNCIYNSLIMRMSVYSVTTKLPFRDHVCFRALGDDNGGSFSNELYKSGWNQLVFGRYAASVGMKATNGGKQELSQEYIDPHAIVFLSRETVYHPRKGHCVGRLLYKSLFKALAVTQPSKEDRITQQISVIRSIYVELSNYDTKTALEIYSGLKNYVRDIGAAFPESLISPDMIEYEFKNQPTLGYVPLDQFKAESREEPGEEHQQQGELANFVVPSEVATSEQINDVAVAPVTDYGSLGSYLDREYEVFQGQFDPSYFHGDQFNPFRSLLTHDVLSPKLDNIALLRSDIKLRIVCSATANHSGSLLFSYLPMQELVGTPDEDNVSSFLKYVLKTSRQHGFVRVGSEDMELEMIIPYLYWHPYINPKDDDALFNMGELSIITAAPIVHAMNASLPVYVTIYAKLHNYKLSGATAFRAQAEFPQESYSSKASVLANMAGKASSLFGTIYPPLAVPAAITRDVMDGIAGVARLFGHSKPLSVGVGAVVPSTTGALCATNVNIPAKTLALDIDQGVSLSGLAGGAETHDTISHDYLLSRKVLVGVWSVTQDMGPGTSIFKCGVTPAFAVRDRGDTVLTPMGIVASQYNLWCGTIHYEIVVSRCASFGGKFVIFHDPETMDNHRPETNRSIMFDVRDTTSVRIEVGWTVDRLMLRTNGVGSSGWLYEPLVQGHTPGYTNGVLSMQVLSPATGSGLIDPTMHVELYAYADVDTVFVDNVDYLRNYSYKYNPFSDQVDGSTDGHNILGQIDPRIMPPSNPGRGLRDSNSDGDPLRDDNGRSEPSSAPVSVPSNTPMPMESATTMPSETVDTMRPTRSYPPGTPQTVPPGAPTSGPVEEPTADSNKPSFWPTFFPTKTPNATTDPPALVATRTNLPTKAPAVGGTTAPVRPPTASPTVPPCDDVMEYTASPWVLTCDGSVGIDTTNEVVYTTNATYLKIPVIGLPGKASLDTTLTFTGDLKVNGASVTSPYTFNPQVHSRTVQTLNVTGSTATIFSVTLSMLKGTRFEYWDAAKLRTTVPDSQQKQVYDVQVQGTDGVNHDAIKLTGGAQAHIPTVYTTACVMSAIYYSVICEGQININHLVNCGYVNMTTLRSVGCLVTGLLNGTTTWLGSGTNSIPSWIVGCYFTVPELYAQAEITIVQPSDLKVGVKPNTTEVLAVCGGERMNSLRSLLQVASVYTSYSSGNTVSGVVGRESLHFFDVTNVKLYNFLLRSHVGVRGGMLRHYYMEGQGPGKLAVYRPVAQVGMPQQAILSRGYEMTDSRVNPAMSVKIPYYSSAYFYVTRSTLQPDWASFPEVGFQLTNMGQGDLQLGVSSSIAEDFALIQFLGSPVLTDRSGGS